jgi:hypothetical protein
MEDKQNKLSLLLAANILSKAVLELFLILVRKFTACNILYVVNNEASCFFGCFQ